MRKQQKSILVLAMIAVFVTTAAFLPGLVRASDKDPTTPPGEPTMHTLEEIYNKLEQIVPDPDDGSPPPPNGSPAPVPKTGQYTSYYERDDGELQKGVGWPYPRFTEPDPEDGTVTDNLTGLMWTKDANYGEVYWTDALRLKCAGCAAGGYSDWRLPNVRELHSLIDYGQHNPALSPGHPFTNVQSSYYWSSSSVDGNPGNAWSVYLYNGNVQNHYKYTGYFVWCVRAGQ